MKKWFVGFVTFVVAITLVPGVSFQQAIGVMPPPLIQKMIQARELLAQEILKKKIVLVSPQPGGPKGLKRGTRAPSHSGANRLAAQKQYRISGAESLLAVDAGDAIKIIRLWETWPQNHQHGFIFEAVEPDTCDVEYAGGAGINRRFQAFCSGSDGVLPVLARAMITVRGDNRFSSPKAVENGIRVVIYSPFDEEFVLPEHIAYGDSVLSEEIIGAAYRLLDERRVASHAYPEKTVTDVVRKSFMYTTVLNEHGDHGEFDAWGVEVIRKKVLTTIAQNQLGVYPTCNSSGACGLVQATDKNNRGTYHLIVAKYPEARLNPQFPEGAYDPVNAVMFAALLYDHELSQLSEWVRAAYDADPRSVVLCVVAAYHSGGGVAAELCAKPTKNVSLDSFQFPKRLQKKRVQLWYYLRKAVDLEHLLSPFQ